jgi:hypothetical protein
MKRFVSLIFMCHLLYYGNAQTLNIATDKTVSLIFPFPIKHVDRGTRDVLVQPVKAPDNILLVKAASKDFAATNLSVIIADGSVYSFPVTYTDYPSVLVYRIPPKANASLKSYANSILNNSRTMHGITDRSWDMRVSVAGIYIKGNTIYYQLRLDNQSPIDYDIDFLRCYIRDRRQVKRTASQENELKPLYVAGNSTHITANSSSAVVIALEKLTVPDAKYLAIELNEKNGGRHLMLRVRNSKIMKAISLADLR